MLTDFSQRFVTPDSSYLQGPPRPLVCYLMHGVPPVIGLSAGREADNSGSQWLAPASKADQDGEDAFLEAIAVLWGVFLWF